MKSQLFQDLVSSNGSGKGRRRRSGLPYSLALHGLALGALILLPMLGEERLALTEPDIFKGPVVYAAAPLPGGGGRTGPRPPVPVHQAQPRPTPPHAFVPPDSPAALAPATSAVPDTMWDPPCLGSECNQVGRGEGSGDGESDGPGPASTGEAPGKVLHAGIDVQPPAKVHDQAPVYPELARQVGVQGVVVIECTIAPSGRVANARVLRGHLLLDQAALDAVTQWVYRPTRVNGVPVAVLMTVTIKFHFRS